MLSIGSNTAASTALRQMRATNAALEAAQVRVATGKKVNSSADNASLWALSQKVQSDVGQSAIYADNIKTTLANAKVATTALDTVSTIVTQIRGKVVAYATADAATQATILTDIASLQGQLTTVGKQATLDGGTNWLDGSLASVSVVVSGSSTDTIDLSAANLFKATTGALTKAGTVASTKSILTFGAADLASGAERTKLLADLDTAATYVTAASSTIGSAASRMDTNMTFLNALNDVKNKAISSLIDADLDAESARITALQTKLSLQTSILQIANQSAQNILRLFQ